MHRWHIQYLGCIELPSHLNELEMESFFTLSDDERNLIQSRYKPNPRIAAAIQLGFLKMAGRPLSAFKVLPAKLLAYIGAQLDAPAPTIASLRALYKRRSTLYEHQAWAIRTMGFSYDTERQRAMLLATLRKSAVTARSIDTLVDVLQRVGQHPASEVHQLKPRLWKQLFAANPLRSDLYGLGK